MTLRSWSKALAIVVTLLVVSTAWTQGASKTGPKYDITKEVKIKGTVTEVKQPATPSEPIVLVVKSLDNDVMVQLAPASFLKEIDCWIKAGEEVEVTGAKVPDATQDVMMAREVVFGNNTMVLRDQKGVPIWELWKP
jgi:hypothetical protein